MPLRIRSPLASLLPWCSPRDDSGQDNLGQDSGASAGCSKARGCSRAANAPFRFVVPEGATPGQCLCVQGPHGRHVEITIPPGCTPGEQLLVQADEASGEASRNAGFHATSSFSSGSESLKELEEFIRATADATHASCSTLRQRLDDELAMQKVLWASAGNSPKANSVLQQIIDGTFGGAEPGTLACFGEELSQTQALVFAAADAGDCKQLLAALAEARKFSIVSRSLEDAAKDLSSAEEAMVTWRCLLDALRDRDRHEMEVWLEQARGLGLDVPADVSTILAELYRQEAQSLQTFQKKKDVEQRLQFALEACDPELLAEVTAEAEAAGLSGLPSARQAAARVSSWSSTTPDKTPSGNAPVRQHASQWEAALGAMHGSQHGAAPWLGPHCSSPRSGQGSGPARSQPPPPPAPGKPPGTEPAAATGGAAGPRHEASDSRSARELLEECRRRCLNTSGCTEREDLIRLLRDHRERISNEQAKAKPKVAEVIVSSSWTPELPNRSTPQVAPVMTVWDRRTPPAHLISRRSQALFLLGLETGPGRRATTTDLRNAYRRAAMESHPDRIQNHTRQAEAKELFQKVKEAFDYLNSPAGGNLS